MTTLEAMTARYVQSTVPVLHMIILWDSPFNQQNQKFFVLAFFPFLKIAD